MESIEFVMYVFSTYLMPSCIHYKTFLKSIGTFTEWFVFVQQSAFVTETDS